MSFSGNPSIARLLESAMTHYGVGNVVELVTITRSGADADMGIAGSINEVPSVIVPEPLLSAISTDMVIKNGAAFLYSDTRMSVAKSALTEAVAMDEKTEFNINGDRHVIVAVTPSSSSWEFVVRRRLANVAGS